MGSAENTKLCDFTSTNNNDFICSPIAPPSTKVESYAIKSVLLNLVMKEQFSGACTEDAACRGVVTASSSSRKMSSGAIGD